MMKNSEDAIDKVLAGLRDSEAPTGMNQRIMAALHNESAERTHTPPGYFRLAWLSAPVAVAVLASALIFQAARHHTHAPLQPAQSDAKEGSARPQPPVNVQIVPPLAYEVPAPRVSMRSVSKRNSKTSIGKEDMDALAEEEMRAASQPAAPLPLSNQEKLLLRMTHKRVPIELAALSPATRAQHDAEEEANFEKFFEPPKLPAGSE